MVASAELRISPHISTFNFQRSCFLFFNPYLILRETQTVRSNVDMAVNISVIFIWREIPNGRVLPNQVIL
jgi:hypothetical protein